jgi:hypothetical protein
MRILLLLLLLTSCSVTGPPVISENFDSALTSFGIKLINNKYIFLQENKGIQKSNAIMTDYVGYREGSRRVVVTSTLPPAVAYSLRYAVKFCPGFDFAKGGKLHGLGPTRPVTGGRKIQPNGWSARLMFRRNGGLSSYVYHQDMKGKYGDYVSAPDFHFEAGKYYQIRMDVRLNQPVTSNNGSMVVYVNGKQMIDHQKLRFNSIDSKAGQISTIMFNTFHGGHTADWAPRTAEGNYKTDCAYFDDFRVYRLPN